MWFFFLFKLWCDGSPFILLVINAVLLYLYYLNYIIDKFSSSLCPLSVFIFLNPVLSPLFKYIHLLLLLLSRFSRVRLCVTPETAAHQALPPLGFSRQEYWSGLPFPSPVHESEKWKWSRSIVSDSSRPHGLQPTRLLRPWDFPGKSTGMGCHCLLRQRALTRHQSCWHLGLGLPSLQSEEC